MENEKDRKNINSEQYAMELLAKLIWETFLIEHNNNENEQC